MEAMLVSAGMADVTAATVSTVVSGIGTAMSALGAISQGNAEASAAKYHAKMSEMNAANARAQASVNEDAQRRQARRFLGTQRASFAQAGIGLSGSAEDVMAQSAVDAELDALNIRYQGELEAAGMTNEANLQRMRAKNARSGGFMTAGAKLLSGIGTYSAGKIQPAGQGYTAGTTGKLKSPISGSIA